MHAAMHMYTYIHMDTYVYMTEGWGETETFVMNYKWMFNLDKALLVWESNPGSSKSKLSERFSFTPVINR